MVPRSNASGKTCTRQARSTYVRTRAPIPILQSCLFTIIQVSVAFLLHHTALVLLSIGNLTIQPPMLDDGRELTPPGFDAPCKAKEDEDYYMNFVTFEVEDRLFRVPTYQFLKESPEFSKECKLSANDRAGNGNPIKLEKVSKKDFRNFLKILYPITFPGMNPSTITVSLSKEEWISVLTLASKWRFVHVRIMAVSMLELRHINLTSIEKICLGRDHSIPSWVIDGFVELVEATTITDFEALRIDCHWYSCYGGDSVSELEVKTSTYNTAYKLFRIRELRIAGELSSAKAKVEEIFKEELDRLRSKEKMFNLNVTRKSKKSKKMEA